MNRAAYPSDLTDTQWLLLEGLIPPEKPGERHRDVDMREIVNSIFYLISEGIKWRREGVWESLNDALRAAVRQEAGHEEEPSAAILDSQSVKTTAVPGERGYDGAKQIKGRKRHILVDVLGLLLVVYVHKASISERAGAKTLLQRKALPGWHSFGPMAVTAVAPAKLAFQPSWLALGSR